MSLPTALQDFAGSWALARVIEDYRSGVQGELTGRVEFTPDAEGLIYLETGTLQMAGQAPLQAERRYLWRATETGITILFDDGRFFHTLPLTGGSAGHWCDPDQYDVVYDFSTWPDWTSRWRVTGPRKDYLMTSVYRRTAA